MPMRSVAKPTTMRPPLPRPADASAVTVSGTLVAGQLAGTRADLAAGHAEITAVTAALREAADRADGDGERPAMLRRQARFLLA